MATLPADKDIPGREDCSTGGCSRPVSFVIPVRNDARRLHRCLASIAANCYPPDRIEIIVADNGSQDDSAAVAGQAGARVSAFRGCRLVSSEIVRPRTPAARSWSL